MSTFWRGCLEAQNRRSVCLGIDLTLTNPGEKRKTQKHKRQQKTDRKMINMLPN